MKKFIIITMSVVLLMSATVMPLSAAQPNDNMVQPCWENTNSINVNLVFIDGIGYAEALLNGKFGSTETYIDVVVYQQSGEDWIYVTEDHVFFDRMSASISCDFIPTLGATYKAEYTFRVYRNSSMETVWRDAYKTYQG